MRSRASARVAGRVAGALLVLSALAGPWASARRIELGARDRANLGLAQSAAAFLSVVVPAGTANGYDPTRLLAAVNTLSRASFWPGGLQLALGSVPLLPDTIGLLPVPDTLLQRLSQGQTAFLAASPRPRVALVPFLDRDRFGILGWIAVWGTLPGGVPSSHGATLTILGAVVLVLLLVALHRPGPVRWRSGLFLAALAAQLLLLVDLRWGVRSTLEAGTALRLVTLKRLIEVAATAPGVRQAMLPEIAVGVQVRPQGGAADSAGASAWTDSTTGDLVVLAATPRTGGALELSLAPEREAMRRLDQWLGLWLAGGSLGLLLLAGTVRYSGSEPGGPSLEST